MTKIRTTGAFIALALLAAGCSGIGDGSKLESIRIAQDLSKAAGEETSVRAFTCLASPLVLVGTFSKGDVGDFAFRARWTSDDESVVKVANFRDPVEGKPGEVYLRGGVLLPQGLPPDMDPEDPDDPSDKAETVVHAEYLGFKASMPVVVRRTANLRITPALSRIVPDSAQKYIVRAELEGSEAEVTNLAELFFVEAGSEAFATVSEEAQLQLVRGVAVSPETPLTLKARFDAPCADAPTAQVMVRDIPALDDPDDPEFVPPRKGLILDYEEGFSDRIAERTTEALRLKVVFGDFNADGDADDEGEFMRLDTFDSQGNTLYGYDRDDDGQCELLLEGNESTNPPTALTFGSLLSGLNIMSAVGDDDAVDRSTRICASFGPKSDPVSNGTLSNVLPLTILDRILVSMALSVSDPCDPDVSVCEPIEDLNTTAPVVDEGTILLIKSQGLFEGDYAQAITRNVIFTSNEPRLAAVGVGGILVTASDISAVESQNCPTTATSCTATITATWAGATSATTDDVTATLVVTVNAVPDDE